MASHDVSLYAVGDVGAFFKDPESMFDVECMIADKRIARL